VDATGGVHRSHARLSPPAPMTRTRGPCRAPPPARAQRRPANHPAAGAVAHLVGQVGLAA